MKKLISSLTILTVSIIIIQFYGCAAMMGYVETVNYKAKINKPVVSPTSVFEDSSIAITLMVSNKGVAFNLKNKTDKTLKLNWDEAALILNNKSTRVMHQGVRYIERDRSQPPSIIPAGSELSDQYSSVDHVYFVSGQYGGWRETSMIDDKNYKGALIGFYLPLKAGDTSLEYAFELELLSVDTAKK